MRKSSFLTFFLLLFILSICTSLTRADSRLQDSVDISGRWNSNIRLIYEITVDGTNFTWREQYSGQQATGQINGLTVYASWPARGGRDSATGKIILDSAGRAVRIEWSNNVTFVRPANYYQSQPQTFTEPLQTTGDLTGRWNSNIRLVYDIVQQGNRFTWTVAAINQQGEGIVTGDSILEAHWSSPGGARESATGQIIRDSAGNAIRIRWSNGVIFIRQTSGQPQVQQPQQPSGTNQQAQVPMAARFENVTLNRAVANQLLQTAVVKSPEELLQSVRTANGLATISSQVGVSGEKILFLANEMEMRSILGRINDQDMALLKDFGIETVRNLAEFNGRPDVLHRFLTAAAGELKISPPSLEQVASWVSSASAAESQSLPSARQLLPPSRLTLQPMQVVKILGTTQKREGQMMTVKILDQPLIATVIQPGQAPGSFVINKGTLEYVREFEATKPGLYCAKIELDCDLQLGWVETSCFVDQPQLSISLNNRHQTVLGNAPRSIYAQPEYQATAKVEGYKPLISGDASLGQDETSYFTFWLAKKDVPMNGRLRFRIRVMRTKKPAAEPGREDFTIPASKPEDHPPIKGVLNVKFVEPVKLNGFSGTMKLPSGVTVGSPLMVVDTPLFQKPAKVDSYLPTYLTFMISHASKLSSQISNEDIYTLLAAKHATISNSLLPILKDDAQVYGNEEFMKYLDGKYSMDLPSPAGFYGVKLIDIRNPETGIYHLLASPDPTISGFPTFAQLASTGWVFSRWIPSQEQHEIHTLTRGLQTHNRYVVEMTALEVYDQSEPDDDDNDEGNGEFKIITSTMLSQRRPFADLDAGVPGDSGLPLLLSWTRPYPIIPDHQRPEFIHIRTDSTSKRIICFPHMPIIDFSDDWLINYYKDLAVNVTVVEDDDHSWWQENFVLIKRMVNFFKSVYKIYSNPGSLLGEIQSGILPLFDSNLGLDDADDKIGSPGIVTSIESKWGLWNDSEYMFDAKGPRDTQYFQNMTSPPSGDVIHGNVTATQQAPWARVFFRVKRFPQVFSWADIQLVGFTLRESTDGGQPTNLFIRFGLPEYRIVPGIYPISWEQASDWKKLYFNAAPGTRIKVRNPAPPKAVKSPLGNWLVPDSASSLDAGILEADTLWTLKEGFKSEPHVNPMLRGYTYFQSTFWDDDPGSDEFLGVASYTLYHDDVWKYAGLGPQVFEDGRILFNSYKQAGSPFYVAEITVKDPGSWIKSVEYVAYVYIAQ